MILTFQIILIVFILLFGMGVIGDKDKQNRMNYTSIVIACVIAMCFTVWIG